MNLPVDILKQIINLTSPLDDATYEWIIKSLIVSRPIRHGNGAERQQRYRDRQKELGRRV